MHLAVARSSSIAKGGAAWAAVEKEEMFDCEIDITTQIKRIRNRFIRFIPFTPAKILSLLIYAFSYAIMLKIFMENFLGQFKAEKPLRPYQGLPPGLDGFILTSAWQ